MNRLLLTAAFALLAAFGWSQGMGDAVREDARASGVDSQKQANFKLDVLDKMGIDQRLGAFVPGDVPLTDQNGRQIKFGDLYGKRPLVIMPMFFSCLSACPVETDALVRTVIQMPELSVGRDFDVVMLSLNPKETNELTQPRWRGVVRLYNRPSGEEGFHFLTGKLEDVRKITNALGFRWTYREEDDQINHPAGLMILSSQGQITSYMINKEFPQRFLLQNLIDAKQGKVGPKSETILFGCIMIDHATGARSLVIENVIRLFAGVFAIGMAIWIGALSLGGRKAKVKMTKGGLA